MRRVASKWPVQLTPVGWAPGVSWPQLLASAILASPGGEVEVFVAHWEGERFHSKSRDKHLRARWRNGVLSILDPNAAHGLRHVWFDRYGYSDVTTHMTKGLNERFFDHLLVSNHFTVIDAGYHHDGWRTHGPSDHSAAWAKIELR